jgi:hypothetical protein
MLTALILIALCYVALLALASALCWRAADADASLERRRRTFG